MDTENSGQSDLFSQAKGYNTPVAGLGQRSIFSHIKSHEKIILLTFAFVLIGIASFSLGVEKGRRIASAKIEPRFDTALKIEPAKAKIEVKNIVPAPAQEIKVEPAVAYAIQLASYRTKSYAQKEADALRKKGYSASLIPKGSYVVLYVVNFTNKEAAQSMLPELKKRFQDCRIIRRL